MKFMVCFKSLSKSEVPLLFILEDNGIRRTSTVLEYKQVSENEIRFETLNTIYHLRLKQNKSLCGVILKHMIQTAEKSNLQNEGRKFV